MSDVSTTENSWLNKTKNDYIEKALNELIPVLGIKEFIDHENLVGLIGSKKIKKAIKEIALYLGLPVKINISYVPKGYRPNSNDGFQSTHLVKTDKNNRGTSSITAQVSIPSNLPFYGSQGMVNFPINIMLSENCAEQPATLIAVMAHELSHIVLNSLWHREKENEFYTDLTAMILGFANIMKIGRKVIETNVDSELSGLTSIKTTTTTNTTTYGYLSDDNFDFAFNEIKSVINNQKSAKNKLLKELEQFKKHLNKNKKLPFLFGKYLEYLDKNLDKKISQEDGNKIITFHQPNHTDAYLANIKKNEISLESLFKFTENLKNYTGKNIEIMQQYEKQLKLAYEELRKQYFLLQKDIDILKKYVSFFFKIKLKFV